MYKSLFGNSLLLLVLSCASSLDAEISWSESEDLPIDTYPLFVDSAINNRNEVMTIWSNNEVVDEKYQGQVMVGSYSKGWQPPVGLTKVQQFFFTAPHVATNNVGQGIAMWGRDDGATTSLKFANYKNGNWGKPYMAMSLRSGHIDPMNFQVRMNDAGDGVAMLVSKTDINDHVEIVVYEGGKWGVLQSVSSGFDLFPGSDEVQKISGAHIAMNEAGDMVVVWDLWTGTQMMIQASFRKRGNRLWSHPTTLYETPADTLGWATSTGVAMNQNGEVLASWIVGKDKTDQFLATATRVNAQWTEPTLTKIDAELKSTAVALNNHGNAMVTWVANDRLCGMRKLDGSWGPMTEISQSDWICTTYKLVLNDAEHAILVYNAYDRAESDLFVPNSLGFVVPFAQEKWGTPTQILPSANDVHLNPQSEAVILGYKSGVVQIRHGSF